MKIKFNKFERVAGIFVFIAIFGGIASTVMIAAQKGWFETKISYHTLLETADGIHEGTQVQMAGLNVGKVTRVELLASDEILVQFDVFKKFEKRIKQDSRALVVRPFIIGEKVIDLTVGSKDAEVLNPGSLVVLQPTMDVMDLLSGRRLGPVLNDLTKLVENFKVLASAFSDKKRTESLVRMFDRLDPLLNNLDLMSKEVTRLSWTLNKKKRLDIIVGSLKDFSVEMNHMLPEFKKQVPNMGTQMGQLVENLNVLTAEFKKLTPAINAMAPELPRVGSRAVEALDEAVVTMKALQKTFILSGNVEDVREEEEQRKTASEDE